MTKEANAGTRMAARLAKTPLLSDSGLHLQYADLVIEADEDALDIGQGALVLRRDQRSLERAEALAAVLGAFIQEVGPRETLPGELPEPQPKPTTTVDDPFGR